MCNNVIKNAIKRLSYKEKVDFAIRLSLVRAEKRIKLWVAQDGKCHYCDRDTVLPKQDQVNKGGLLATLDHIVTQSCGGTDSLNNMVVACYSCNNNRLDMDYQTFYSMMKTPGAWAEHKAQLAREKAERDEVRRQDSAVRHLAHIQFQKDQAAAAKAARMAKGLDKTARNNLIQQQAGHNGVRLLAAWVNRANFAPRKEGRGWIAIQDGSSMEPHPWMDLTGDTEFYINDSALA